MLALAMSAGAQNGVATPLKVRPDAFPPEVETTESKAIMMAETVDEMASWDRYPTYETYVAMMQQWAASYPGLCRLDTIGTSLMGRLILALHIEGSHDTDNQRPQFFYSSTIHGDEVTGYVMMLRLIDTLLTSYGNDPRLTDLVDATAIYINPLANPDGTYFRGNASVQGALRYNARFIDLNRNYPDPFGGVSVKNLEQENEAMIAYVAAHQFRLSANLHGGSEVMNYPWDCFTSAQNPHPAADWWSEVGRRFVDTCRRYDNERFRDVIANGVIAGGDWYVIHGGRQDYMNYFHHCLEMTMEVSSVKLLPSERLPDYWHALSHALINYIDEIHSLPEWVGVEAPTLADGAPLKVFPNPVADCLRVDGVEQGEVLTLYDLYGRRLRESVGERVDMSDLPAGVYTLRSGQRSVKVIKK